MSKNYVGNASDRVKGEDAHRVDATSNFNNETYAESVKLAWLTKDQAERVAAILNENVGDGPTYFQVRPHGHRLWRGMEELI